ncbi:MAG TPA: lytic transglycosylase domain-containing protein [Baekduia sp.]|nr:lytic transglycosylase domain-containing protein [Baekduia sp.]
MLQEQGDVDRGGRPAQAGLEPVRVQRVRTGGPMDLLRVTLREPATGDVALLAVDAGERRRVPALPGGAGPAPGPPVVAFAVPAAAAGARPVYVLELAGRGWVLPDAQATTLGGPAPPARSSRIDATVRSPPPAAADRPVGAPAPPAPPPARPAPDVPAPRPPVDVGELRLELAVAQAERTDALGRLARVAAAAGEGHALPGGRRTGGAAAALAAVTLGVVVLAGGGGDAADPRPAPARAAVRAAPPARPVADVPGDYVRHYRAAGRRYALDWAVLAAVGELGSRHGRLPLPGVAGGATASGARGPAQFLDATWRRFGVDADGDGRIDPYSAADAIHAMAAYLRASGAPQDWHGALRAYRPQPGFAAGVLARAAALRRAGRRAAR